MQHRYFSANQRFCFLLPRNIYKVVSFYFKIGYFMTVFRLTRVKPSCKYRIWVFARRGTNHPWRRARRPVNHNKYTLFLYFQEIITLTFTTVFCCFGESHLALRARLTRKITRFRLEEPKPTCCTVVLIIIYLISRTTISLKI